MTAGRILVTHPGRQHSHQMALALARVDRLAGYWSGAPSQARHGRAVPRAIWRRFVRYAPVELPAGSDVRWAPWMPALRRVSDRLPRGVAARADFRLCRAFDRWVARRLESMREGAGVDAVMACEISARDAFEEAKRRGWTRLLDAPSIHHAAQDRLHGFTEPADLHRRITKIKDEEIAAADLILTVSSLARETYVEAGVPSQKVIGISLGADLDLFATVERPTRSGPCRVLFAGATIRRKGFDLLVDACQLLEENGVPFELRVVGPAGEEERALARLPPAPWRRVGRVDQGGLARELAAADLLVLPSRNDSYGMVVAEALAAGTPVVVSTMVGARDAVEEGRTGWIVPVGDVAALAHRLRACALDPQGVRSMSVACRASAQRLSWESYYRRFVDELDTALARLGKRSA